MNEHIKCENKNWQQTVKLQIKQQLKKCKKQLQQQKNKSFIELSALLLQFFIWQEDLHKTQNVQGIFV